MATHGELTVGKLQKFLKTFDDDTKVVIGQLNTGDIISTCHANLYFPNRKDQETDCWVIIDPNEI